MGVHLVVFDKLTLAKKLDKYYKLATNGLGNAEENTLLKTDIKAI